MEDDPLLPQDPDDRMGFGIQCFFMFGFAVYGAFHWPPNVNVQGFFGLVIKALSLEFILLMIPFGLLGMIWAVMTPEWVRYFLNLCFKHLTIVIMLCFVLVLGWMALVVAGVA